MLCVGWDWMGWGGWDGHWCSKSTFGAIKNNDYFSLDMKKLIFEQKNVDTYVEKTGQSAIDKFLGIRDMPETPTQTRHITTLEYDQLSHKIAV